MIAVNSLLNSISFLPWSMNLYQIFSSDKQGIKLLSKRILDWKNSGNHHQRDGKRKHIERRQIPVLISWSFASHPISEDNSFVCSYLTSIRRASFTAAAEWNNTTARQQCRIIPQIISFIVCLSLASLIHLLEIISMIFHFIIINT